MIRRAIALALALLWGGAAAQPCEPFEGGGRLVVEGLMEIEFARFATDRGRGAVLLSGGLCAVFVGFEAELRADRMELFGLEAEPLLRVSEGLFDSPLGSLAAPRFEIDRERLLAFEGLWISELYLAVAERFELPWGAEALLAQRARIATERLWIDAERSSFVAGVLEAEEAWLTTCACPPGVASARIEAERLRSDPASEALSIFGGTFVSPLGRGALPSPFLLSEENLRLGELPVALGPDRTLIYRSSVRERAPGLRLGWALSWPLFTTEPVLALELAGASDRARFDLLLDERGYRLGWSWSEALSSGWRLGLAQSFDTRNGAQLSTQDLRLARGWSLEGGVNGAQAHGEFGSLLALVSERQGAAVVQDVRVGLFANASLRAEPLSGVNTVVAAATEATHYVASDLQQLRLSLAPGVSFDLGFGVATLAHRGVWVVGGSPFSASVDRATPLQRSEWALDARWGGAPLQLSFVHRGAWLHGRPADGVAGGFAQLDSDLVLRSHGATATAEVALRSVLARLLDASRGEPPKLDAVATWQRDPWRLSAQLGALGLLPGVTPRSGDLRFSVAFDAAPFRGAIGWRGDPWAPSGSAASRGRFSLAAGWTTSEASLAVSLEVAAGSPGWSLASVELAAGLPLTFGPLRLRPEFAVELTRLAAEGWTLEAFSRHALAVEWSFDVATVVVGYRAERSKPTTAEFSLRLPLTPLDRERFEAVRSVPLRGP